MTSSKDGQRLSSGCVSSVDDGRAMGGWDTTRIERVATKMEECRQIAEHTRIVLDDALWRVLFQKSRGLAARSVALLQSVQSSRVESERRRGTQELVLLRLCDGSKAGLGCHDVSRIVLASEDKLHHSVERNEVVN